MGAHVWLPDYVKRALLPHLRITGWTPDWYDGFPALTYYFPLPIIAIAVVSYVIPYSIAFKLVTILGLVTLPVAAWALGRLARLPFPGPACLALATLPFLFSREFTIYGGNIASTMAGEFSFSISLSFALLFLGLAARGVQDGKHRASAALVLACVGLCHILPLFFAVGGAIVLMAMSMVANRDWRHLRWGIPVLATGGALIAFWALPFWFRLPYATNMGYGKLTNYLSSLFPGHDDWLFALAILGFLLAAFRRNRVGVFLGIMLVLCAVVFRIAPAARLWNARVLPFWFLCLYLLAGVAFSELGLAIVDFFKTGTERSWEDLLPIPFVTFIAAFAWVGYPLHLLPFGHVTASGQYDWLGVKSSDTSFIPGWVYWNYSGYQSPGKARSKEYFALVAEMKKLGQDPTHGCGRAMWQYEPELDQLGTPDALMLLPYWTQGCIGSQEGLYYESSATTPYHFLNAAELSDQPSNPVRGLDYPTTANVAEGVQHLQMLGVKYFMAETPDIEAQADADSSLLLVGTVGPFPVTYTTGSTSSVKQRTWKIYQILDSDLVTPLLNQPVVMTGVQSRNPQVWLTASESWYLDPNRWDVVEAASGPKNWARVSATATALPRTPLPSVQVSNIKEGTESISFDVDQTGVPVLVKTSYFPNWQASGATGIYRVTPNLMVVVPTATHVTLTYGYTPVDWIGFILSLFGLGSLILLWRIAPVAYRERPLRGPTGGGRRGWSGQDGKVPGRMASIDPEILDSVFKAYDIRGTVPDQMNAELASAIGVAFARFCEAPRLLVARDMRESGVELVRAFSEGAASMGVDVIDLGLTSTDEMYFASGSMNAPGAMFTASHNPAQYNGIKLCRAGARPVGADTGLREIKAAVAGSIGTLPEPSASRPRGSITQADVLSDYAAKVRSFVDPASLKPLKVVADTANGMGGLVVPAVFEGLPFRLEVLFGELDGSFPNHPADPIQPANLVSLTERILQTEADVGLAFDGDADRCFLVDDLGVPLSGSTTTSLVAAAMLDKHPGATILCNLICSKAVSEIIRERGGTPVRTRVGHSYIKAVMADTDALFGGEHSGHYYFRDNYRADSGAIAALVVLEVLSKTGRPLSEIRKDFERYSDSGEINTEVGDPAAVIEAVARHYEEAKQDRLDGLTVDFGDWWFNLRSSNTEPLLRLNLEAPDRQTCEQRTAEVLSLISAVPTRSVSDGS
jgi:phosphomannomutase